MKFMNTLCLLAVLASMAGVGYAQPCFEAAGFSTNPDAPFSPDPCGIENTFDWRESIRTVYWGLSNSDEYQSPYLAHPHFKTQGEDSYLDFNPEDGWELLMAAESELPPPTGYSYFILYNKYASIIRLFFTLDPLEASDVTQVRLKFSSQTRVSGLLHPSFGMNQPLDQPSPPETAATVRSNNTPGLFMYVDIPVEYDPCTCTGVGGVLASLQFHFRQIKTQELVLKGRFDFFQRSIAEIAESNIVTFSDDWVSNVLKLGFFEDELGTQTFATFAGVLDYYKGIKEDTDVLKEKYERLLEEKEVIELVSKQAGPLLEALAVKVPSVGPFGEIKYSGKDLMDGILAGYNYRTTRMKRELDGLNSKLNRVGGSSIANGEAAFRGTIVAESSIGGSPVIRTPGTQGISSCNFNSPYEEYAYNNTYPRYNEVLGRFALLETPKLNVETSSSDSIFILVPGLSTPQGAWTRIYRFDPQSFDYVFNPAAQIIQDSTQIWAAIEFTQLVDEESPYEPVTNLLTSYTSSDETTGLIAPRYVWQTPSMPLSCLSEYVATITTASDLPVPVEVTLKLYVDFSFPEGAKVLQVYAYPLQLVYDEEVPLVASPSTPIYGYTETLTSTHYTEDELIFAWSSIKIDGNLTTEPGVKVEIVAPNIILTDGATIGSDILLRNSFVPFTSCEPIEEYPSELLAAYCSSNKYQARLASYTIPEEESALLAARAEEEAQQAQASRQAIALRAFPNPLEDFGTLEFVLPADMQVSAYLSDMHGQRLQELVSPRDLPAGRHLFDLSLVNLPPGMYLLTLQTPDGPQTVKLVRL
jgi:hypothetical protein